MTTFHIMMLRRKKKPHHIEQTFSWQWPKKNKLMRKNQSGKDAEKVLSRVLSAAGSTRLAEDAKGVKVSRFLP